MCLPAAGILSSSWMWMYQLPPLDITIIRDFALSLEHGKNFISQSKLENINWTKMQILSTNIVATFWMVFQVSKWESKIVRTSLWSRPCVSHLTIHLTLYVIARYNIAVDKICLAIILKCSSDYNTVDIWLRKLSILPIISIVEIKCFILENGLMHKKVK